MNFSSKVSAQTAILFLFANTINLVFFIAHLMVVVVLRPIFIYEYFLVAILILLRFPPLITWLFWFFILMLDLLNTVSAVFLFKLPEFLNNLEFSLHYSFSFTQYLSLFLFCCFLYINFWCIQRVSQMTVEYRKHMIIFFIACIALTFILDYLNGSSRLARHQKKIAITQLNIGGSALNLTGIMLSDFASAAQKPANIKKSITYRTFANDTTGNQLLILVESWGLPARYDHRQSIQDAILNVASKSGWNAEFGSTEFEGSTTSAELRELLNLSGNFRYFLNPDSAARVESIFTIKKKQGFSTMAAHSFSGRMFWRVGWWRNIGIDSAFFLEDIVKRKKLKSRSLNYATPFVSVNDEDTYSFISSISAPNGQKKFVYFLTENSHLPFHEPRQAETETRRFDTTDAQILSFTDALSTEGIDQLKRVQQLVFFFIQSSQSKQWSKILIMGDHMPPFTNNTDRQFYSFTQVPYVVLYPNN